MSYVQSDLIYAMGIDPGGTSAWSVLGIAREDLDRRESPTIRHFKYGMVRGGYTAQVLNLRAIIATYYDPFFTLAIALESFNSRKPITSEEYFSPIYINSRIQFLVDTKRIRAPLFYQTPSEAMEVATDKRLKHWGLYPPGEDHPKDATRHAITFIRRCQDNPALARQAWPTLHYTEADAHRIPQYLPGKHDKRTKINKRK